MKKWQDTAKMSFLVVQFIMLLYFLINPINYNNMVGIVWFILSCIGLFIVAFSLLNIPYGKKSKLILFGIFCLSLLSIAVILLFIMIEYITQSMY